MLVDPENCRIGSHVRVDAGVVVTPGAVAIGNFVHISGNVHISAGAGLRIGNGCNIGQGAKIYTKSDNYLSGEIGGPWFPAESTSSTVGAIALEGLNIIGANSIIGPGIKMARGSCVGANSFLKASPLPWEVWAGNPAKKVRNRVNLGSLYYAKLFGH